MSEEILQDKRFGVIAWNKAIGGYRTFFGSKVQHSASITIEICEAVLERKYGENRIVRGGKIMEIELSPLQFSEFITSGGKYGGAPCTFTQRDGEYLLPLKPIEDERSQAIDEFTLHVHNINQKLAPQTSKVAQMIDESNLPKKKKEELIKELRSLHQEIGANTSFMLTQFQKQIDRIVLEGKSEIEAKIAFKIEEIGKEAVQHIFSNNAIAGNTQEELEITTTKGESHE